VGDDPLPQFAPGFAPVCRSCCMALSEELSGVLAMYEGMLDDEEGDVIFKLADGEARAHRAILRAASDVFACMFKQAMRENIEGVVDLPDVSKVSMRVFLRLIYTGHVDASDWHHVGTGRSTSPDTRVLQQANVQSILGTEAARVLHLTSQTPGWTSSVLLDSGLGSLEFCFRSANWAELGNVMIGIVPRDTGQLVQSIFNSRGFWGFVSGGCLSTVYAQDGTRGKAISSQPWPSPLPLNAKITLKYSPSCSSLMFAVDDGPFATAPFNSPIPRDTEFCAAVTFYEAFKLLEVVDITRPPSSCPLATLIEVASLAKKYMVKRVLSRAILVLQRRLAEARARDDTDDFEQILAGAIASDMVAVRMAALDCARNFPILHEKYERGKLRPEIACELESIWPALKEHAVFNGTQLE